MAQARYKFNSSSYPSSTTVTPDEGSAPILSIASTTLSGVNSPTPYEGAYCLRIPTGLDIVAAVAGQYSAWDMFIYLPTGFSNFIPVLGDASYYALVREWCAIKEDGQITIEFYFDDFAGSTYYENKVQSATGLAPINQWFRLRVLCSPYSPTNVQVFKGSNILGTTPDGQISTSTYLTGSWGQYLYSDGYQYQPGYIDDLYISNDGAYPSRTTVDTARLSCGIIST